MPFALEKNKSANPGHEDLLSPERKTLEPDRISDLDDEPALELKNKGPGRTGVERFHDIRPPVARPVVYWEIRKIIFL